MLRIIFETLFWCIIMAVIGVLCFGLKSPSDIHYNTFPIFNDRLWYITCYCFVFLLAPYLNLLIAHISKSAYRELLLLLTILMCAIPTVCMIDPFHVTFHGYSAGSWDVVREVLGEYKNLGKEFDTVMLLQPTSPLRTAVDIINAFNLKEEKQANAIVSVCEMDHSPLWSNTLPESLLITGFVRNDNLPRQKLPKYYRINGAIYLVDTDTLVNGKSVYDNNCFAYIMPRNRSVDIEAVMDFIIAESVIKNYCQLMNNKC